MPVNIDGHHTPPVKTHQRAHWVSVGLLVAAGSIAAYIYASPIGKQKTDDAQLDAQRLERHGAHRRPGQARADRPEPGSQGGISSSTSITRDQP